MGFSDLLAGADSVVRAKLGDAVTYTPGTGAPVTVNGVFDSAYVLAESGRGGVATSGPAVFLSLADLPSDPTKDLAARVTVNGVTYKPREPKPDGLGGVLLLLHEV